MVKQDKNRRLITGLVAVFFLSTAITANAFLLNDDKPNNTKFNTPRYAKIALDEKGTKILTVIFDDSTGAGTKYDTLYLDTSFGGKSGKLIKVNPRQNMKDKYRTSVEFPYTALNVAYNSSSEVVSNPCSVAFSYYKSSSYEAFSMKAKIYLKGGADIWEYTFQGPISVSSDPSSAQICDFKAVPAIALTTKPDTSKKGYTGFGVDLKAGKYDLSCRKSVGGASPVNLVVKDNSGKTIHKDAASLDKFYFG